MEVTKLAALLQKRMPEVELEKVDAAVRGCQINSLTGAIVAINGELEGPLFQTGELSILCAQLGVEVGSGLQSVMHLTVSVGESAKLDTGTVVVEKAQAEVPESLMPIGAGLPPSHWIYAAVEPVAADATPGAVDEIDEEVRGKFVDDLRTAARNAIRKSTSFGKDMDFDPDALIIELVSELCGQVALAAVEEVKGGGK